MLLNTDIITQPALHLRNWKKRKFVRWTTCA